MHSQIVKFIYIGLLNTGFYYLLYSTFLFIGFDYRLAVLCATIIGVLFSFKTFGTFVFNQSGKKYILRFVMVYLLLYLLNILLITFFEMFLTNYYISGFFATIICAFFSFLFNKYFVFTKI